MSGSNPGPGRHNKDNNNKTNFRTLDPQGHFLGVNWAAGSCVFESQGTHFDLTRTFYQIFLLCLVIFKGLHLKVLVYIREI